MATYSNPLELAKAELGSQFDPDNCSTVNPSDNQFTERLHINARDNGFIDEKYWVDTATGLLLPSELPERTPKFYGRLIKLRDLKFMGELKGFDKFSLGKNIGAWCLTFGETVLAPGLDKTPEKYKLWVPAVSIREIDKL
jgi:hypothetical protein